MNTLTLKIDLHVHTCYSYDAIITLEEVVAYSKKRGLDGIAITDHDTLCGALKLTRESELIIIPGVEITTRQGHVLALNITTPISPRLGLSETIQRIHDAGGIAVAAHPTAVGKEGLGLGRVTQTLDLDAIEVINSAAFPYFLSTYLSRRLAAELSLPQTAGSDSHIPETIGMAYTVIDADPEVDEIIHAIKRGATIPTGKPIPWMMRLQKLALSLKWGDESAIPQSPQADRCSN